MKTEDTYIVYTDASFDDFTKIGTYAVIVMQENKVLKRTAKRCRVQMKNSTECEVFAIYQAINIILSKYLKSEVKQSFKLRTDSVEAKNFFSKYNDKIFADNQELHTIIRKTYAKFYKKVLRKEGSLSLTWIPREANKIAHKWSYLAFQKLRGYNEKKEIILIDKSSFFEILLNGKKEQNEIIKYLFYISNENKVILKTQREMSKALNMSISKINKNLKQLIKLGILEKVKNGYYAILI